MRLFGVRAGGLLEAQSLLRKQLVGWVWFEGACLLASRCDVLD